MALKLRAIRQMQLIVNIFWSYKHSPLAKISYTAEQKISCSMLSDLLLEKVDLLRLFRQPTNPTSRFSVLVNPYGSPLSTPSTFILGNLIHRLETYTQAASLMYPQLVQIHTISARVSERSSIIIGSPPSSAPTMPNQIKAFFAFSIRQALILQVFAQVVKSVISVIITVWNHISALLYMCLQYFVSPALLDL